MSLAPGAIARSRGLVLADLVPGALARDIVLVLAYAGLTGLAAQVAIPLPFTPVPVTGQTFSVLLGAAALGSRRAVAGMLLYVAAGVAGMPWFAGHASGMAKLTGVTGGYLAGFVVAAAVVGRLARSGLDRSPLPAVAAMVLGSAIIVCLGVAWLAVSLGVPVAKAVSLGATPFLAGDAVKIALAALLLPATWSIASADARRRRD